MDVAGDHDLSATQPEKISSTASFPAPIQRSLHLALGGGAVADVLLWRRRNAAAFTVASITAFWFLFERSGYRFLSLISNSLLLLVTVLFFWAKSASLLNRRIPRLPDLEISDEVVARAAVEARVWINRLLSLGHEIVIGKDGKVFLEVIIVLWFISYIGSFFNFLTLVYIGSLSMLTFPAVYDKYQDHVDEKVGVLYGLVLKQYDCVIGKTTKQSVKEKKTQ